MSNILSIDPGKRCGYFSYSNNIVNFRGIINGDDIKGCNELILDVQPKVIICEDQFDGESYNKGKKIKFRMKRKNKMRLYYHRFAWEVLAALYCIKFIPVLPRVWQCKFQITGHGDERKKSIIDVASKLDGIAYGKDVADARLIFEYARNYIPEVIRCVNE